MGIFFKYLILHLVYLLFFWVDILVFIVIIDGVETYLEVGDPSMHGKANQFLVESIIESNPPETAISEVKPTNTKAVSKSNYIEGSGLLWCVSIICARLLLGV